MSMDINESAFPKQARIDARDKVRSEFPDADSEDARRAMDSRRRESFQALLPLRAMDLRRACWVLAPSSLPSRDFLTM